MAITTGTATHQNDLLADLRTWLVGTVGWTELEYTAGALATDVATLSVQGPGGGVDRRVHVNIETGNSVVDGFYYWKALGAIAWDSGVGHDSQPGAGGLNYFNLWQNSIDYWFYANDRRFIVEAKVSSNYMSCYYGFFLPFALPSEYPFPLATIGSYPEPALSSLANARNSAIDNPGGDGAAWYRRRTTEEWEQLKNQGSSSSAWYNETGQRAFVWPKTTGRTAGTVQVGPNYWASQGFTAMRLNANNETPLIQAHIVDMEDGTVVGALEGVYSTCGFNRSSEQLLSYGGRDFRLFQRAFRNGPGDFMAIEEV